MHLTHSIHFLFYFPVCVLGKQAKFCLLVYLVDPWAGFEKNKRKFSPEDPKELQEGRKTYQKVDQRELDEFRWEKNPNKGKARKNP